MKSHRIGMLILFALHTSKFRSMINTTNTNVYFSNLASCLSETTRKIQIDAKRKDELKQNTLLSVFSIVLFFVHFRMIKVAKKPIRKKTL